MELVEFLRARYDEDERVARLAKDDATVWQAAPTGQYQPAGRVRAVNDEDAWTIASDVSSMEQAEHIARHDPARVLRDVEADRKLIELVLQYGRWAINEGTHAFQALATAGERILKIRAERFADHPDYDPSWAPASVG